MRNGEAESISKGSVMQFQKYGKNRFRQGVFTT